MFYINSNINNRFIIVAIEIQNWTPTSVFRMLSWILWTEIQREILCKWEWIELIPIHFQEILCNDIYFDSTSDCAIRFCVFFMIMFSKDFQFQGIW